MAEERFFDSGGVKLRYTVEGDGPEVILIHGFTASGDLNWRMPGVVRKLLPAYRVITLDVRGHGKSSVPAGARYGVEMVYDVVRLMDELNIEQAHIAGYSMGGMIAIKMMTLYPDRVRSALIGGMAWVQQREFEPREDLTQPHMAHVLASLGELATTRDEMEAIRIPAMVVIGSEDDGQMERVENWKEIRPDLPVVQIEGAGHMNCIFKPDFRQAVRDWLDEQSATETAVAN